MLRIAYGPLWGRREQSLNKMLLFSLLLHLTLFIGITLSRSFWGAQSSTFQSFQVSLVDTGGGGAVATGGSTTPEHVREPEKSSGRESIEKKAGQEKQAISQKPPATPAAVPEKQDPAPVEQVVPTVRAPRSAVNPDPVEDEDPERLEEWWKKQKKSLTVPKSTPAPKPKMGTTERTRTAKIDIQKRPATPPVKIPSPVPAPAAPTPENVQKNVSKVIPGTGTSENSAKNTDDNASENTASGEAEEGNEQGSFGDAGGDAGIQTGALSGIKGVGASGGNASFNFPSYLQKVDQKIRWQWAPPPVASGRGRLVVRFVVNKDGAIDLSSIKIEESSGNHFSDQAALRAVFAAHPLPPLPKAYRENLLTVYMSFVVREDS